MFKRLQKIIQKLILIVKHKCSIKIKWKEIIQLDNKVECYQMQVQVEAQFNNKKYYQIIAV